MGLVKNVSRSLSVSMEEANNIINEQANLCRDMLSVGDLEYDDVEQAMADMGVEPDLMEDFLFRMM